MQIRDLLNIVDGKKQVISELKYGEEDPENPGYMWVKSDSAGSQMTDRSGNMVKNGSGGYWNAKKVPIQGTNTNTNTPTNVPPAVTPAAPEVNTEPDAQNLPPQAPAEVNTEPSAENAPVQPCGPEVQAEIMKQKSFKAAFALARKSKCPEFTWCQIVDVGGTGPKPTPQAQQGGTAINDMNPDGTYVGGIGLPSQTPVYQPGAEESIEHQGSVLEDELGAVLRLGNVVHEAAGLPEIKAPTKQQAIAIAQKKGIKRFRYCGRYGTKLGKGGTAPQPTPRPKPQPQPQGGTAINDMNPDGTYVGGIGLPSDTPVYQPGA